MNDQQQAAMQMALENFAKLYRKVMDAGNLGHQWTGLELADGCRESIRAMSEALAQPQGEWVDLTDDEIWESFDKEKPVKVTDLGRAAIAKFKEKNTPPVVPQGEPVAYLLDGARFKIMGSDDEGYCKILGLPKRLNGEWVALVNATDDRHLLYTTPPTVEALLQELADSEHDVQRLFDLVGKLEDELEAAIEATKEKAAKVCEKYAYAIDSSEEDDFGRGFNAAIGQCAAAIRSMK